MSGRGPPTAPGMMRHGPPPGVRAPAGAPVTEIDHILMENRRLAESIVAMRHEHAMADQEILRLRAYIRSTETESDIQMRVLLEKISNMELALKGGETMKKDLQQAHKEAQSLVAARQELVLKIQEARMELEKWQNDIKNIPDMLSEVESMKLEHQHLRSAFELEKRMNLDIVEHLQKMEKTLTSMDREKESLRAEIQNVEKRVQAPYGGAYPNSDAQYPSLYQTNEPYYDSYRIASLDRTAPHSSANGPSSAAGIISNPPVSSAAGRGSWVGAYDPNMIRR